QSGVQANVGGASVTVNVPAVQVNGTFDFAIDTTGGVSLVQVNGNGVEITIAGQTLRGNVQIQSQTTQAGKREVRVGVQNLQLSIGDGATTFASITNGNGSLLIDVSGVAASFGITVALNIPGVSFGAGATISLQINTRPQAVNETFTVGGVTSAINLPPGSFLRIAIENASLTLGGVNISGNFYLDQTQRAGGGKVTRFAGTNIAATVSGQGVTNAEGAFVVLPPDGGNAGGLAGFLNGDASGSVGGVSLSGRAGFRINKSGREVNETFDLNGKTLTVKFSSVETDIFQFFANDLTLNIGNFVSIEGSVSFTSQGGQSVFGGEDLSIFFGQGPSKLANGDLNPLAIGVRLENATIGVVQIDGATKTYALTASGDVALVGISGVTAHGRANIRFNNTGQAIDQTITIPNTTHDVVVRYTDGSPVKRFFSQGLEVGAFGQTLKGDFNFGEGDSSSSQGIGGGGGLPNFDEGIPASVANIDIGFNNGPNEAAKLTNGAGAVLLKSSGIAARLSGTLALGAPGVSLTGTFGAQINTTGAAVNNSGLGLDLPAGPYIKVSGSSAQLTVLGQTLSGSFSVEQRTVDQRKITRIAATNVSLTLGGASPVVSVTQGHGDFVLSTDGIAGELGATVDLSGVPGVTFTGQFDVKINNTNVRVADSFDAGGQTVTLDLPAGPYLRVEGTG
ncbi:MAG TPA: hypothetical protein VI282_05160, partial [Verrucomicrobiae bacterium]